MNIGKLNKRITFQQQATGGNGLNEPTGAWTDVITVWADVMYKSATEKYEGDKLTARNTIDVIIRHRTDINAKMRVLFNGYVYDMQPPLPHPTQRAYDVITMLRREAYDG